jgi:hypothetical protein
MQYKITKQYARDIEMPIAEFDLLAAARFFIKVKLECDAKLHVAAIFRLYRDKELMDEINHGKISTSGVPKRYFSDEGWTVGMHAYQVVVQDLVHSPVLHAVFIELQDAYLFIEKKLTSDSTENKKITYRILQNNQLVKKFSPSDAKQALASDKTTLHATPFNTAVFKSKDTLQKWLNGKFKVKQREEKENIK